MTQANDARYFAALKRAHRKLASSYASAERRARRHEHGPEELLTMVRGQADLLRLLEQRVAALERHEAGEVRP